MKISVALATYNGERFIRDQLASLAAQTRVPDELVVNDDMSTDGTLGIVAEFARTAPFPVRIHRNERNLGFGDNFLEAAKRCRGDWIAFCDQDDVWLPDKIAICERYTEVPRREVLVVAHNAEIVDASLTRSGLRYLSSKRILICSGGSLPNLWVASGFTMMFRADLVSSVPCRDRGPDPGLPDAGLAHDVWICRLARILGDVVILPQSLALYRRHDRTTTGFLGGGNEVVRRSKRFYQQVRFLSRGGADNYRRHARAAGYQARIFGRLGREAKLEKWSNKFLNAERDYGELSKWLLVRSRVYGDARVYRRLLSLSALILGNGHLRFNGCFWVNWRKVLKDLVFDCVMAIYGPRTGQPGGDGLASSRMRDGDHPDVAGMAGRGTRS